jgi:hypothetical protein
MQVLESLINAITTPMRQLYSWFANCMPGIQFLSRLSLPWKWALLALMFLLITWMATILNLWLRGDAPPSDWMKFGLFPIPLILLIPFLVYHFVRYWMMEAPSRYPEIDRVWSEGLRQMNERGISITKTPIFLVLGTENVKENKKLLHIGGLELPVHAPSAGDAPISFHASERGAWLFVHGCNCISRLNQSTGKVTANPLRRIEESPDEGGGTIDASAFNSEAPQEDAGRWGGSESSEAEEEVSGGTMLLDENQDVQSLFLPTVSVTKHLSSQDAAACEDQLGYVCQLIRKHRDPICPINGLLTLLPLELVESSSSPLVVATQKDLAVLRGQLQVRIPNTVVVKDMERDLGFIELIRRFGPQQASDNRFGKGADSLWVSPDGARLSAIALHATAAFEDWIYKLFQQENALKKKHNSRLFGLLCRMRGKFAENLQTVLKDGFGFNPATDPHLARLQFLFDGCYFAATGAGPSEQAFLRSVIMKMMKQEGELEWAPAARAIDSRYQHYANLMALLGLLALLAIAGMIAYYFKDSLGFASA